MNEINELLEFMQGGDMPDAAKEYLAEKQIELVERQSELGLDDTPIDEWLIDTTPVDGVDTLDAKFQAAIDSCDKKQAIEMLRSGESIPAYFGEYVADLLCGNIKPKRGKPKNAGISAIMNVINKINRRLLMQGLYDGMVELMIAENSEQPKQTRVIERLSDMTEISESHISNVLKGRR